MSRAKRSFQQLVLFDPLTCVSDQHAQDLSRLARAHERAFGPLRDGNDQMRRQSVVMRLDCLPLSVKLLICRHPCSGGAGMFLYFGLLMFMTDAI
jgi:hypothetical protein